MPARTPQEEVATELSRIMANVAIPEKPGCWLWQGSTHKPWGAAACCYKSKKRRVARILWLLLYGEEAGGFVLHRCDNPRCVRPDHLFVGTHQDNMTDMARKGRGRAGSGRLPHGVYASGGSFGTQLRVRGKKRRFGNYKTAEEAAEVVRRAKAELYGGGV